jgi:N-glycosylase/DNA lyase
MASVVSERGPWSVEIPLAGPGGEPIDFRRTILSHGVAELPPMHIDELAGEFDVTLPVPGGGARTVRVGRGKAGFVRLAAAGRRPGVGAAAALESQVRGILALDEDLSGFYAMAAADADLSWVTSGAGRMIRSATVFEEVVKTVCTTNCAWSATIRMVGALVEHLGERAPGAPPTGSAGRTFPSPRAMAEAGEPFYRNVVRAGYRAAYLRSLARSVAFGEADLEALRGADGHGFSDEEVAARLLALPGVGPYAAAHVMMMLGRYSRLILDSWTRPTYARLVGRTAVKDSLIERRFRPYGRYAGLAFWLFLTRSWVEDGSAG